MKMSEYVLKLYKYINEPYFKNNPTYIDMWRTVYEKEKDPNILLLLFNADISTFYHWIYVEFSRKFLEIKRYDLAKYVLEYALENKVYDKKILLKELKELPVYQGKYSSDLHKYFQRNTVKCLGKVFDIKEKYVTMTNIHSGNKHSEITHIKEDKENKSNIETQKEDISKNLENVNCLCADFSVGGNIKFADFALVINEIINDSVYKTIKVKTDETAQIYIVFKAPKSMLLCLQNHASDFGFVWNNEDYFCFNYIPIASMSSILQDITFKNGLYKYFYANKIWNFLMNLENSGYYLNTFEDFYIDNNFNLRLKNITNLKKVVIDFKQMWIEWFGMDYSTFSKDYNEICDKEEYLKEVFEHKKNLFK